MLKLISQVEGAPSAYRDEVVGVILACCRADGFAHVPSFRWLVKTLFAVAGLASATHGVEVARLLLEVTLRVPAVRAFAAEMSLECVECAGIASTTAGASGEPPAEAALLGAAYVLGEHSALLPAERLRTCSRGASCEGIRGFGADAQASCIQAALRVLTQSPGCGGGRRLATPSCIRRHSTRRSHLRGAPWHPFALRRTRRCRSARAACTVSCRSWRAAGTQTKTLGQRSAREWSMRCAAEWTHS